MPILAALTHVTEYAYDRPVQLGPHIVRLRPAPYGRAIIQRYALTVGPGRHLVNWLQDPHGNWLARVLFQEKTRTLRLEVDLLAALVEVNPFDFLVENDALAFPFAYQDELREDLKPFLAADTAGPRLGALLAALPRGPTPTVQFVVDLNRRIARQVGYVTRLEHGVLSPEETLERGAGSCRDTGWLLVQALRHLGLAARFVSGYLIQLRSDGSDGSEKIDADRGDLHAWAEVYLPGAGWIGLDPTSGLLTGEGHIPLVAAPHHRSAAPITGSVEPAEVAFSFGIEVGRAVPEALDPGPTRCE